MRATPLALLALALALRGEPAAAIYCDEKNCYEVLGLPSPLDAPEPATERDIKKAYRSLSMQWHPDKNPTPEAEAKFVEIAAAYEVLSDETARADYDDFLLHPEAHNQAMHYARYYKHVYAPEVPLWLVLLGFVVIMSAIQWPLMWSKYLMYQARAKETSAYKQKVAQLGGDGEEEDGEPDIEIELV